MRIVEAVDVAAQYWRTGVSADVTLTVSLVPAPCRSRENTAVLALSSRLPDSIHHRCRAAVRLLSHIHLLPGCSTQLPALHHFRGDAEGRNIPTGNPRELCGAQLF